jgi:DnaD/phage-associated family protein
MFQAQIDRSAAQREQAAQAHRASGKLGGRPKNQNGFDKTKQNQNGFEETKKTYNKDNNNNKDNNKDNNNHHQEEDEAGTVEAYASMNLQHMSPGNIQDMIGYMQDLPDDVIRFAIDEACGNGAPRWAYVSSILAGYMRDGIRTVGDARAAKAKRQAGKTQLDRNPRENPALQYSQREYKADNSGKVLNLDTGEWEAIT